MKKLLLLAAICIIGYVSAGPFVTLNNIRSGIETDDLEKLSANIDFSALRQNIKDQLDAQLSSTASSIQSDLGSTLAYGFASMLSDKFVDRFITPAGLSSFLSGKAAAKGVNSEMAKSVENEPSGLDNMYENMTFKLISHNKFRVLVEGDNNQVITIILKREGLAWKLTNIMLPLK